MLWRFSKIKTLEVREISAQTITWKVEVGIAIVFSTVLTLSPALWWSNYMWQVWFLAIKLHTSAISISLPLLFFQPFVSLEAEEKMMGQSKELKSSCLPTEPQDTAGGPELFSSLLWFRACSRPDLGWVPHSPHSPHHPALLLGCHLLAWTSRTSQKGKYILNGKKPSGSHVGKQGT